MAIARAVLQEPAILLADEPTASLDERNAARIADLLAGFAKDMGSTLIMVSHAPEVLGRAERVMERCFPWFPRCWPAPGALCREATGRAARSGILHRFNKVPPEDFIWASYIILTS